MSPTIELVQELAELGVPAPDSLERLDRAARSTFAKVPSDTPSETFDPFDTLRISARVLDLWRVLAGVAEAVVLTKAYTYADVRRNVAAVLERTQLLTRIDPIAVLTGDPAVVQAAREAAKNHPPDPDAPFPLTASTGFVRLISSLVEFCPIDELVALGEKLGNPELGHRCRLSYDWLRAFVRRHTPGERDTLHVVGRAYSEGRLRLEEAAHLLSMPKPDAVAWLEEHGYARDLKLISLSDEDRREALAAIRTERRSRGGKPQLNTSHVARDVIASQRIEGVDARPWLQPGV